MINTASPASNNVHSREIWFWYNKINLSKHVQHCGAMVKELLATCRWSGFDSRRRCFLFLCTVFFSIFNPIFPFGLFSFIDTADPADHALGSIYVSLEFYFGKWISRALDLHTGQAYGQKKHKQTITLRWTLCSPFWKSSTRDVTSYWQEDWATYLLGDTFPPPARKDFFFLFFGGLVGKLLTVAYSDEAKLKTYLKINVSIWPESLR